uniref:RNA-directed DNA polymerase n=1 Tax=Strongyloides papillosus TaxID=174720 RepID=A0A0N5B1Z6_STREA
MAKTRSQLERVTPSKKFKNTLSEELRGRARRPNMDISERSDGSADSEEQRPTGGATERCAGNGTNQHAVNDEIVENAGVNNVNNLNNISFDESRNQIHNTRRDDNNHTELGNNQMGMNSGVTMNDVMNLIRQMQRINPGNVHSSTVMPRYAARPPPEHFKGKEDFDRWFIKFNAYCRINQIPRENRIDELILMLEDEPLNDIINDPYLQQDYDALVDFLSRAYRGSCSRTAAMHELSLLTSRRANKVDDIDDIASKISKYVEVLEAGKCRDDILQSKIENLSKVLPFECQSKFLFCSNLSTYDAAIAIAKRMWILDAKAEKQKALGNGINSKKSYSSKDKATKPSQKEIVCHGCKGIGHIKANCPKKSLRQSNNVIIDTSYENSDNSSKSINEVPKAKGEVKSTNKVSIGNKDVTAYNVQLLKEVDNLIGAEIVVENMKITSLIDTGANCLILSPSVAEKLGLKTADTLNVKSFQGTHQVRRISAPLNIIINNEPLKIEEGYVTTREFMNPRFQAIIGMNILEKLNCLLDLSSGRLVNKDNSDSTNQCNMIVTGDDPSQENMKFIESLKSRFPLAYAKHEYDVGPGLITTPVITTMNREPEKLPFYSIPIREKEEANNIIRNWIKAGVLEPTDSTLLQPIMILSKKDDPINRKRFIADVRAANSITIPIRYKPPEIQQILADIGKYSYVSKIDLKSAFYQISIPKECRHLFAIKTDIGNLQFTRLVQGGKNSSALFQKVMDELFLPLKPQVQIYIDDILLISKGDDGEHRDLICKFFDIANRYQLKISLEKSQFFAKNIQFLGFDISPSGIKPSSNNVETLMKRKIPKTKKELYSFLQACGYYRRFIPQYSKFCETLYDKCKGRNKSITLNENDLIAYNHLRESLINAPKLSHPNTTGQFILTTDASNTAIGCTLSQIQDNVEEPIAYFSQKLKKTVRARAPTYLELYAISRSLRHFKYLLTGCKILIRSDHKPLLHISNSDDKKYVELLEDINQYDCTITYIPGEANTLSDYLSRINHDDDDVNNSEKPGCNATTLMNNDEERDAQPIVKRKRGRPKKSTSNIDITNNPEDPEQTIDKLSGSAQMPFLALPENLDLISAQENDDQCQEALIEGDIDGFKIFKDDTGLVKVLKKGKNDEETELIYIPNSCVDEIFKLAHDFNSHYSFLKTKEIINKQLYIPSIAKKLTTYLNNCDICKRRNITPYKKLPMKTIKTACPMSELSMDIMGPINITGSRGQKYILNIIDNGSRYIFPIAIRSQKNEEVIDALTNEVFLKYGFPSIIRSDNASNFKSTSLCTYMEKLNIKMDYSTPYYSQSNSPCERNLRTIQAAINKLINMTNKEWDTYLPFVAYTYNTSHIESLGTTPFELMFYRKAPTCLDLFLRTYTPASFDTNLTHYEVMEKAAIAREIASENYTEFRNSQNKKLKCSKIKYYEPNQEVYIKNKLKQSKFSDNYIGPLRIVEDLGTKIKYESKAGRILTTSKSNIRS